MTRSSQIQSGRGPRHHSNQIAITTDQRRSYTFPFCPPRKLEEIKILELIRALYAIEGEARENNLTKSERHSLRGPASGTRSLGSTTGDSRSSRAVTLYQPPPTAVVAARPVDSEDSTNHAALP